VRGTTIDSSDGIDRHEGHRDPERQRGFEDKSHDWRLRHSVHDEGLKTKCRLCQPPTYIESTTAERTEHLVV